MIHCHCEPLERLLPELPPLLQAHWDESEAALFGPQVYALDTKRYAGLERLGMLHVVMPGTAPAACRATPPSP